jgi:hypothetical protein
MEWDIVEIEKISGYKLKLKFQSGETGTADLSDYKNRGGVFKNFTDPDYFRQVFVSHGVLCWPGDVDIAPETVYNLATGNNPFSPHPPTPSPAKP